MRSTITSRGQTVIPAAIRRRFNLSPADRLEWIVENGTILLQGAALVHKDPEFEVVNCPQEILPYK
jgi:AbrB family looped-hinge helix DNA binding protein